MTYFSSVFLRSFPSLCAMDLARLTRNCWQQPTRKYNKDKEDDEVEFKEKGGEKESAGRIKEDGGIGLEYERGQRKNKIEG